MGMRRFASVILPAVLAAIVVAPGRAAWADTVRPALVVEAGTSANFTTEIANETAAQHAYALSVTGLPAGVKATFVETGPVVSRVTIAAHASDLVTVRVAVPKGTAVGHVEASILARRDDGTSVATPLALDVQSTYRLEITSAAKNVTTFSGQDFTLDVTAVNAGATAVHNVAAAMDIPPKWVLLSDPASVASLAPGKEAVFHLRVTVPASQVAIVQPASVSVTSDQVSSDARPVSVRVQASPAYLPIAGGTVLVAIGAVAVYFRRKGRR